MSKSTKLIVPIKSQIDQATAELCLKPVEMFLNQNKDLVLIAEKMESGNIAFEFQKVKHINE